MIFFVAVDNLQRGEGLNLLCSTRKSSCRTPNMPSIQPHFGEYQKTPHFVPTPPPPVVAQNVPKNPPKCTRNPPQGVFWYILGVVRGIFLVHFGVFFRYLAGDFFVHIGVFFGTFRWAFGTFRGGGGLVHFLGGVYGTFLGVYGTIRGFCGAIWGFMIQFRGLKYTPGIFRTFCWVSFWVFF